MEFLVEIELTVPAELSDEEWDLLTDRERVRGRELQKAGTINRIWRVPGTANNVGIWKAEDASELHSALSSLPLFKYMDIAVKPLAVHPLER